MPRKDPWHGGVYAILFVQGISALLPWNVFITAASYFADRLQQTSVHESFLNWFSLAFNLTTLIVVGLNAAFLRPCLPLPARKITVALGGISFILLLTATMVKTPYVEGNEFFGITMASIVVVSICSAYLQEGLFEITALLSDIYTQAILTGQSMAGLGVSLSAYILTYLHHNKVSDTFTSSSIEDNAFIYFACSFATILFALALFLVFQRLTFVRQYLQSPTKSLDIDMDTTESLLDESPPTPRPNPWKILWQVRHHAFSAFFTLFVTLTLFPVVTSSIQSSSVSQELFVALTFVLFNFGDLAGRVSTSLYVLTHKRLVVAGSIGRIAFVGLFFLCNVHGSPLVVFTQDGMAVLFLLGFAWSNGYFCSVAMMQSPHEVDRHHRQLCGAIMFACLCVGLTAGSIASFALRALLKV
ncbi:hypothetical protein AC1031_018769 [Aphanomyces cochlioides]|nr:hypothetical protein AC1031_018769 [Aphanomyces cochlioides]